MAVDRAARWRRLAVFALLALFALQAWLAALRDSVTIDELAHVPVGLYVLRHGEFSPDPINPPLSRAWAALPVAAMAPRFDPPLGADEWKMGLRLMRDESDRYHELYVLARGAVIVLALGLGLLVHRWSRALHGEDAALVALVLFAFSPALLAHGHLATADLAGTLGVALALHRSWRHAAAPSFGNALLLGAIVGVALLLKLSCVVVMPVAAYVLLAPANRDGLSVGRRAGHAVAAGFVTLLVIGGGYGFQGFARPLSEIALVSEGAFASLGRRFPSLALPLPEPFVRGLDLVASAQLKGDRSFYLAGEISDRGWWYYHLVAYALKTPIPLLAAIVVAASRIPRRAWRSGEGFLWAGVGVVFLTGGVLNPLNLGVRHVLAAEPLLIVLAAPAFARALAGLGSRRGRPLVATAIAAVALGHYVVSSARVAPRYLEYFNEAAGGPSRGHEWLADSNLDWGQDLVRLRAFMDAKGLERVELAYFGTVHPGVYGIAFDPLTPGPSEGVRVVSASLLVGLPFPGWKRVDLWERFEPGELAWLQSLRPTGRVGSLFVFEPGSAQEQEPLSGTNFPVSES